MVGGEGIGIPLNGRKVSTDSAYSKVIELQAQCEKLRRECNALKKDRDQIADEYNDIMNARTVPFTPIKKSSSDKAETVRIALGDLHGMRQDRDAVAAFLCDMKATDPDEIVLGGDMLECGGWLAKHQPVGYVALCDYTYQEDVKATNDFLDRLQDAAPNAKIYYLEGNHEQRVERWAVDQTLSCGRDADFLLKNFGPESVLRLADRNIQYFRRDAIHVKGAPRGWIKLGKVFYTHELGSGKHAASHSIDKTAFNVGYFHTHIKDESTRVFPETGIVTAFCPGCLCVMQAVWKHSEPSGWTQGYDRYNIRKSGNFLRINFPIYEGESFGSSLI